MRSMSKEQIARNINYHIKKLEELQRELERPDELTEKLGRLENGTVIRFHYQFSPGGIFYEYAAVKARNRWYTTGPRSPKEYTDEEFSDWLNSANSLRHLNRAVGWVQI